MGLNPKGYKPPPPDPDGLQALLRRLCPNGAPGFTDTLDHILVRCYSSFEANAYEDWGFAWRLTLPQHKHHWKGNDGSWIEGTTDAPIAFGGANLAQCVMRANDYLDAWAAGGLVSHVEYERRVKTGYYKERMKV